MIRFDSDYTEGCHPRVLAALAATNLEQTPGYGTDGHCIRAAALTTLLGYLLNYFMTLYFSKKVYPCKYGEIRVGIVLAVMYFLCMLGEKLAVPYRIGLWVVCAAGLIIIFKDIIGHMVNLVRTKFMKGRNA